MKNRPAVPPRAVLQRDEQRRRYAREPSPAPSLPLAARSILPPIVPQANPSRSSLIQPNQAKK